MKRDGKGIKLTGPAHSEKGQSQRKDSRGGLSKQHVMKVVQKWANARKAQKRVKRKGEWKGHLKETKVE